MRNFVASYLAFLQALCRRQGTRRLALRLANLVKAMRLEVAANCGVGWRHTEPTLLAGQSDQVGVMQLDRTMCLLDFMQDTVKPVPINYL